MDYKDTSFLLLLVRHGRTLPNADGRYISTTDVRLSDNGIAEVEQLARTLCGTEFARLITSPARRARESAEILAAVLQLRPETDQRLVEIDFGPFEGLTPRELRRASGPLRREFEAWREPSGEMPVGAESFSSAAQRALSFLDDVVGGSKSTVVVSHSVILRIMLVSGVLSLSPADYRKLMIGTGRLAELHIEGRWLRLVSLNSRDFLGLKGHSDLTKNPNRPLSP